MNYLAFKMFAAAAERTSELSAFVLGQTDPSTAKIIGRFASTRRIASNTLDRAYDALHATADNMFSNLSSQQRATAGNRFAALSFGQV